MSSIGIKIKFISIIISLMSIIFSMGAWPLQIK